MHNTGNEMAELVRQAARACLRPFGYLAFAAAVWMLAAAASLLGREHALGDFAGRVSDSVHHYPIVTRPGVATAWLIWALLLAVAISPFDPLPTVWDEIILIALASGAVWSRAARSL